MPTITQTQPETAPAPMLIERLLPDFDATRIEHRVIPGDIQTVYAAMREADLLRAVSENPAVRIIFALRAAFERLASAIHRQLLPPAEEPESMRVGDMPTHGEWILLGEDPPVEFAFGVIGRFWGGETVWEEIDAAEFADFDRPGLGKIAANFHLKPHGSDRMLVSYEARTKATDAAARKAFLRYWRPLSPFIGVVMRSALRVIESDARARAT